MYQLLAALGHALAPPARLTDVDQMIIETMIENGFHPAEIQERFGYDVEQIGEAAELLPDPFAS